MVIIIKQQQELIVIPFLHTLIATGATIIEVTGAIALREVAIKQVDHLVEHFSLLR